MANPVLIGGFDTNGTNTEAVPALLQSDGYSSLQVVESKHYNEMFKQLFAAANKNRNDGVWEWEDPSLNDTEYNISSVVSYLGSLYISLIDLNTVTPTDDFTNWIKFDLSNYMKLTGNQTVADIKTFTSFPITPSLAPTTNYQVANKKYVDDNMEATWVANDSRAKTALNAGGTAPIYACRAWVNFDGTGTRAIRASGNVSSITDNGTGQYTVNFTTNMKDSNFATTLGNSRLYVGFHGAEAARFLSVVGQNTSSVLISYILYSDNGALAFEDSPYIAVSIFN